SGTTYDECYDESDGQSPCPHYGLAGGESAPVDSQNQFRDFVGMGPRCVDWYRQAGSYGVSIPCSAVQSQNMGMYCDSFFIPMIYETNNQLSIQVNRTTVRDCRSPTLGSGDCADIPY